MKILILNHRNKITIFYNRKFLKKYYPTFSDNKLVEIKFKR